MKKQRNMRIMMCGVTALFLATCGWAESPPGLTVQAGLFYKNGNPFHGVGINYFSCFTRMTGMAPNPPQPDNRDYVEGFRVLKSYNIPFVRFCAGGFWPNDWMLYQTDKNKYFELFDGLVAEAEKQGMGLVPSLFWTYSTIPDLMDETLDQWGNPESETIAFMRQYTTEVVSRYVDSPAVWAWEFGNEYLHETDLPQPKFGRGWIAPEFGTPASRSGKDKMLRQNVYSAYRMFYQTVRRFDETRPVLTGDVMPRPAGWHNSKYRTWDIDSPAQWKEIFLKDNPFNTLSGHFYYYNKDDVSRDVGVLKYDPAQQMKFLAEISRESGKPLFLGEFGQAPDRSLPVKEQIRQVEYLLALIQKNNVPLSVLWNYDFEHEDQMHCNITGINERVGLLNLLKGANSE